MRILFLSRRFLRVRLGYVTEINRPIGTGKKAVQGLGKCPIEYKMSLKFLKNFAA